MPPEADDPVSFALLSRHISRLTVLIGLVGALIAFFWRGPTAALSFAAGSALSLLNIAFFRGIAASLGSNADPPLRASRVLLMLRILLMGLGSFAILRASGIVVPALLFGLLASAAAVFLEILYLLFYART